MMNSPKSKTGVLSFTKVARERIERMFAEMKVPENYFLRVGMQGAGCGGMSYLLGFDAQKPEDQRYEIDGLEVIMDKRHGMYLLGMEIDFLQEEDQAGFIFNNPQARPD